MTYNFKIGFSGALIIAAFVSLGLSQILISAAKGDDLEIVAEEEQEQLKQVFPDADVFSAKSGRLPHHKAYKTDSKTGDRALIGFVFMTHEVEPEEWAYSSEIEALVGLTTDGTITKVIIVDHYEPFGYFSIDPPEFIEQFEGKSILDPFEEGRDIDVVTRATITVEGAARVIRKSARQIARQHLRESKNN